MRIILDTDKRTITVPWNYQKKLQEINAIIMEATNDPDKQKTFIGYIDEIWKAAIADSDKYVLTGKEPKRRGNSQATINPAPIAGNGTNSNQQG